MATATTQSPNVIEFPQLTPKQEEIWDTYCEADDGEVTVIGWGGSYGGGKSAGLIRFAIYLCAMYPGINVMIARNTLQNLKGPGGTMAQFNAALPNRGALVKEGGIVVRKTTDNIPRCDIALPGWPAGIVSSVFFRGMDDDSFFKSAEIGAFLVEEADGVSEDSWKYGISRLRQTLPDGTVPKYLALAVANPSISWFKEWFIDDLEEHADDFEGAGRVLFFPSRQEDNPFLPANYQAILRATLDDDEFSANAEGSFSDFRGQIFANFSPVEHAIYQHDTPKPGGRVSLGIDRWDPRATKTIILHGQYLTIPRYAYAVGGLDFAGAQKKAHLSTGTISVVDKLGRDYLIDTFADNGPGVHKRQKEWMEHVEQALGLNKKVDWGADGTQSVAISYLRDEGFNVFKNKGSNDAWRESIHFIRDRFQLGEDGLPKSFYMATERNKVFARQIQQYRVNMKQGPDGVWRDKPIEKDDDVYDAYRYQQERLKAILRQLSPAYTQVEQPRGARPPESVFGELESFIAEARDRKLRERAMQMAIESRKKREGAA